MKIRKGQTRKLKSGEIVCDVNIQIPADQLKLLGWEHGNDVQILADVERGLLVVELIN